MKIAKNIVEAKSAVRKGEMVCVSQKILDLLKKRNPFESSLIPHMKWEWVINEASNCDDPRLEDPSRKTGDDIYIVGSIGTSYFEKRLVNRGVITQKVSSLVNEIATLMNESTTQVYGSLLGIFSALNTSEIIPYLEAELRKSEFRHSVTLLPDDIKKLDLTQLSHLLRAIQIELAAFRRAGLLKHAEDYEKPRDFDLYQSSLEKAESTYKEELSDPKLVCNINIANAILSGDAKTLKYYFLDGNFTCCEKVFELAAGVRLRRLSKINKAKAIDSWASSKERTEII